MEIALAKRLNAWASLKKKEIALAKNKATQPLCQCQLCHRESLSGMEIVGVEKPPPSIFCPYLDMWRSQYFACCCSTPHKDGEICQATIRNNISVLCQCPRCCDCMKEIKLDEITNLKVDCDKCIKKSHFYIPCHA